MLSYPLTCGLLQPLVHYGAEIKGRLSYPLTCGLLQLSSSSSYYHIQRCHTHSHVGFCNGKLDLYQRLYQSCHTHSHVGFCNIPNFHLLMVTQLSYPLTCGLLQPSDWQSIVEMFRTSINDKPTPSCYFRKYT